MTPRWLRPSLSTGLALALAEQPGPEVMASAPVAAGAQQTGVRSPLSWEREDAAIAAGECPWHPDLDFPDSAALLRHVIRHARCWEAEAMHAERLRRSLEGQVREFTSDVRVMVRSILGETP